MLRGLALVLITLALAPAAAVASVSQESIFEDDDMLLHSPPASVDATMAELAALGVDRVRLPALWRVLAPDSPPADPTDPAAYEPRLAALDHAIASAYNHGLAVLVNVRGGAPDWAQGSRRPSELTGYQAYRPSHVAFEAFVRMLGRRYDGTWLRPDGQLLPAVRAWSVWNEPNWHSLLSPQSDGRVPVAADIYRRLYRAARRGLVATGHRRDMILLGETAPLGVPELGMTASLYPGRFYRRLFCLTVRLRPQRGCGNFRKRGPLVATGVAHHPYPVMAPPEFRSFGRDEIRLADASKLERIIDAARRHGRINGRLPLWYTEFGYQTAPPDPYRGVPLARQAAWNIRGEYVAYRNPRVRAFDQFLLRDTPPQKQFPPEHQFYWSTYQTGLYFDDGRPKPALDAYRLPLLRLGPGRFWGVVRPAEHGARPRIFFERHTQEGWVPFASRTVANPRGYFTVKLRRGTGPVRFVWNGMASRPAVSR